MVICMKVTGFSIDTQPMDIMDFLEQSGVKDFEMFLSLESSGARKNSFDGTGYVLVKSECDTSAILRLKEQRFGRNYINITRSSLIELKSKNLYPPPAPSLFEMPKNTTENNNMKHRTFNHAIKENNNFSVSSVSISSNQNNIQKNVNKRQRFPSPDPVDPYYRIKDKLHKQDGLVNESKSVCSSNGVGKNYHSTVRKAISEESSKTPYDCYVKAFYISHDVTRQEIFSLFKKCAFPLDILFSHYDTGPHAGKNRGEVFILLSSKREAHKCLELSFERIRQDQVFVIIPSKEDIDTVIFQNDNKNNIVENVATTSPSHNKDKLAHSLLHAVTSIMSHGSKFSCENNATMVNDYDTNTMTLANFDLDSKINNPIILYTVVRIGNVSSNATSKDILKLFSGYPFISNSIRKITVTSNFSEWEISFETYQDAILAIKKLNYQLIKCHPIELRIIS